MMADLDRMLLDGRPHRVVHLPTAAGLESAHRLDYWRRLAAGHFAGLGIEVETIDVRDRATATEEAAARIEGVGGVFLSGGNPGHLVESLRDTPVWAAIIAAWDQGAVLSGCSAGAMAMSAVLPHFRSSGGEALGLLDRISVIPHYDRFGRMMKPVLRLRDREITVVGIDENTAIHGGPDHWQVYGSGAVHVFAAGSNEVFRAGETLVL